MTLTSLDLGALLPSHIANYLGRKASHADWESHLAINPVVGLSPQWQVLEEGETEAAIWGLHSITVDTASGAAMQMWPESFPGGLARIEHARDFFGEPLIQDRDIAVFQIKSPEEQEYAALCTFTDQGRLQSLTMVRVHDWIPLAKLSIDSQPMEPVGSILPVAVPVGLCGAGAIAPLTGWYEGQLPEAHPMQAFFAKSDARLVFREKGERFPNLGVTPHTDEVLVQWSWTTEIGSSMQS